MPRIGAEAERRQDLINAAIHAIGKSGSLDVSVKNIAEKAGMSPALAFHYFGGKDEIISETMRFLLRELANSLRQHLKGKTQARQRLYAIVDASFAPQQFKRKTISTWLVFYVHAYSSKRAARLLNIYTRRLASNLIHGYLVAGANNAQAKVAAESTAAMIDGIFIRHALRTGGPNKTEAVTICRAQIDAQMSEFIRNSQQQ